VAYREPGNDDELDARLDDELSAHALRPGDWRTERDRRRSWLPAVLPFASIGFGTGMIFGHSVFEIVLGLIAGVGAGFLISFLVRVVEKSEHSVDREERDDEH
jgi:hypothetical protein